MFLLMQKELPFVCQCNVISSCMRSYSIQYCLSRHLNNFGPTMTTAAHQQRAVGNNIVHKILVVRRN